MQFQVMQRVLVFQILLMVQCRLADIDRHYFRGAVRESKNCRLVGAATRNQNVKVWLVFAVRPQDPMSPYGIEELPISRGPRLKVGDRGWVLPPLILAGDAIGARIVGHLG